VADLVDRLNEPESRFHPSLVSNVLDLVNLLPQLNVGEDPELNRFAGVIRKVAVNHHMAASAKWRHKAAARGIWRPWLKAVPADREAGVGE
jgi:hypothetical protein